MFKITLIVASIFVISNATAIITTRFGEYNDWAPVIKITENLHAELMKEYSSHHNSLPHNWSDYCGNDFDIFRNQFLTLVVCCNDAHQIIGYFMYQVKDNHAYLDAFAYNQHKTDGHQFKDVLKQYFASNYPSVEKIFAFWPVASSQGWLTLTNRRFESIIYQNHWKIFGFVEVDNPLAKSDPHYCGSPLENSKRNYRAYVLNIHSTELRQTI